MIEQINEQAQDEYNAVTERQMLELQKRQLEESDDLPFVATVGNPNFDDLVVGFDDEFDELPF